MITFNFTKENYTKGRMIQINREFAGRVLLELLGAIFVIVMTNVVLNANKQLSESIYLLTISGWIVFCVVCNIKIKKELVKQIEEKINSFEKQDMFGKSTMNFIEEGICVELNGNKRIYPWNIIRDLKSVKGNLYIYIGSIDYLVIPEEAFKQDNAQGFIKKMNNFKNKLNSNKCVST